MRLANIAVFYTLMGLTAFDHSVCYIYADLNLKKIELLTKIGY